MKALFLGEANGSAAALSSTTIAAPTFTADVDGTYIFPVDCEQLNNGQSDSLPATVSIISKDTAAPIAVDVSVKFPWKSPCVPVTVLGDDVETNAYQMFGKVTSLPSDGFLSGGNAIDNYLVIFGTNALPGMNPQGTPGRGYDVLHTV